MKIDKDKNYTIELYENLGKKYIQDIANVKSKELPEFIKILPKKAKILEIGCAGGRDAKFFIKKRLEYTGIDLVDKFLKEARKNAPQGKFIKMDFLDLKFPDNYFDAIWASAVLLHINKRKLPSVLKGFYRVLKIGGKLHIRVKRGRGIKYVKDKISGGRERIFTFFYKKEMENYLKEAGFKIIASRIFPDELGRKDVKWVSVWGEKISVN